MDKSKASSSFDKLGANPPSSPTAVYKSFSFKTLFISSTVVSVAVSVAKTLLLINKQIHRPCLH